MRLRNIILIIFVVKGWSATAQVPHTITFPQVDDPIFPYIQPESVGVARDGLEFLRQEIISWVDKGELIGGEVLIVKSGQTIFHESFGWSDKEFGIPMERNEIYHTSSMSKPFSTTLILKLHESGVLSIDDPVQKYIVNFPDSSVKVYQLMNHTSGFSGWGPDGEDHKNLKMFTSLGEWVESWTEMGQTVPVGDHHYTNYNNAALLFIAEKATHKSAKTLTEELILKPYGLKNTYAYPIDPKISENIPPLYRWSANTGYKKIEKFDELNWPAYAGAFGIFSTAGDYALFMQYWMNKGGYLGKELLSYKIVLEAFSNDASGTSGYEDGSDYGYGWQYKKDKYNDEMPLVFLHGGIMRSYAMAFPAHDLIVVYLTHSWKRRSHREAFIDRFYKSGIIDIEPGLGYQKYDNEKIDFINLSQENQQKYLGTYLGEIAGEDEIPLKINLHYKNGFLESRGAFPGMNLETFNTIGFFNAQEAHPVVQTEGNVKWYNPELKIKFIEESELIVGYEVYRKGVLEAVLRKVK